MREQRGGITAVHCRGKQRGGEGDDGGFTIYWFPGEHVAVAWIRPAATILDFLLLVPGHQKSRGFTECGSGATAPHRLHLWPREEFWTGGGRGGPGLTGGCKLGVQAGGAQARGCRRGGAGEGVQAGGCRRGDEGGGGAGGRCRQGDANG